MSKTSNLTHPLLVLPDKKVRGFETLDQLDPNHPKTVTPFEPIESTTAFEIKWDTDAHFTFYVVEGETTFPRIKKPGLSVLRSQGLDVKIHHIAFDYDNHDDRGDKKEWDANDLGKFLTDVEAAETKFPILGDYSAFYTTNHGARWVYTLSRPISPEETEEILSGLCSFFLAAKINVDKLQDWTRLMRLPRVIRNGKSTEDNLFFFCTVQEKTVDPKKLPHDTSGTQKKMATIESIDSERPHLADIILLLQTKDGKPTAFSKAAKRRLQNKECYACCFEEASISLPGARNNTIWLYSGQIVSACYEVPGSSPEACYGLLYSAVEQLEDEQGKEPWLDCLWRAIKTSWEREQAQLAAEAKEQQEKNAEAKELWEEILDGYMAWAKVPGIHTREEYSEYLQGRLILYTPAAIAYIMQRNGVYCPKGVRSDMVSAAIRDLQMGSIIPRYVERADAKGFRAVTEREFKNTYGFSVNNPAKGSLNETDGVILDFKSNTPLLPSFKLNPRVRPRYNQEVDLWLRKLCKTKEDYELLCMWIGHSLHLKLPIAALALIGPPAVGKQLLVRGLAENLLDPCTGEFSADNFQETLLQSPFVIANEGFPIQPRAGVRMADHLRKLVSGDPIRVNQKYKDSVEVSTYFRVIITANNSLGLQTLYAGQDLTEEDKRALAQRLVAIYASEAAAIFLRNLGGMAYTAKKGSRWVGGPAGESDYIVAGHFRYLYENRKKAPAGNRFLVEGTTIGRSSGALLINSLSVNTRKTQDTLIVLAGMFNQANPETAGLYLVRGHSDLQDGIYTTTQAVLDHARKLGGQLADRMHRKGTGESLRFLSHEEVRTRQLVTAKNPVRMYRLDMGQIGALYAEDGHVLRPAIQEFVEEETVTWETASRETDELEADSE